LQNKRERNATRSLEKIAKSNRLILKAILLQSFIKSTLETAVLPANTRSPFGFCQDFAIFCRILSNPVAILPTFFLWSKILRRATGVLDPFTQIMNKKYIVAMWWLKRHF
jgi:hypothetical protein